MLGLVKRVRVGMVWSEVTLGSGCLMDPTYLPYGLDWIGLDLTYAPNLGPAHVNCRRHKDCPDCCGWAGPGLGDLG